MWRSVEKSMTKIILKSLKINFKKMILKLKIKKIILKVETEKVILKLKIKEMILKLQIKEMKLKSLNILIRKVNSMNLSHSRT